jgi:hypothetical protein
LLQHRHHLGRQILVHQVARRQVDADAQIEAARLSLLRGARGSVDHPGGELADEAGLLGERNEITGQHQSASRMLPAQQRLGGDHLSGLKIDFGLQVQAQLAGPHGLSKFAQQRQRLLAAGVQARFVELGAVALSLGRVHRQFGAAEQRAGVASVQRMQGDADARAKIDRLILEIHRQLEIVLMRRAIANAAGASASVNSSANSSPPRRARHWALP